MRGKSTHDLVEQYKKGETRIRDVPALGLFRLLKAYLESINNIHSVKKLYSHKYTIGQVDCIAEYNGKLSVIDFKTANKERNDEWNENYYIQCYNCTEMYEIIWYTHRPLTVLMASKMVQLELLSKTRKIILSAKKILNTFINIAQEDKRQS